MSEKFLKTSSECFWFRAFDDSVEILSGGAFLETVSLALDGATLAG